MFTHTWFFLEIRVIIKIESHPCYPIICFIHIEIMGQHEWDSFFMITLISRKKSGVRKHLLQCISLCIRWKLVLLRKIGHNFAFLLKGQLIAKYIFGAFKFFQKKNKNKSYRGIIVVKLIFFVLFLEELMIPKSPFEINWPLISLYFFC